MDFHHRSHHSEPCCHKNHHDYPSGLKCLSKLDCILIDQEIQMLKVLFGYETNNKFTMKDRSGQKIYYAYEETHCCTRICLGHDRPFDMLIVNNRGIEVIHLYRPLRCQSSLLGFCCLQIMTVEASPGNVIGIVKQKCRLCCPRFTIENDRGEIVLRIAGPCWKTIVCCGHCGGVDYLIMRPDGKTIIGKISKEWTAYVREVFTDADFFVITFPVDLDVRMKAVLIGACILINSMYYEEKDSE